MRERFAALERAFAEALSLEGNARQEFLDALAAHDPSLAIDTRALVDAAGSDGPLDALGERLAPVRDILGHEPPNVVPVTIGPYRVTSEIGRGGMGVVYRAHDPRLGRDVAIKVLPHLANVVGETEGERRFRSEARASSALDHPGIATIHDVGALADGRPWFAMAYYPGGTLADRIAAGPMAPGEARDIAVTIADALAVAHAAGIVHRDVKPGNVAFGDRGEPKLLDFGVATLRDDAAAGTSAGTPAYMSPEGSRGERVDARADVWALGVVLYEMLAGHRPFTGESRSAVLRAIAHDAPPPLASVRPDVPPALAAIVASALRKRPDDRPASAAALAGALRAVSVDAGSAASPRVAPSRDLGRRGRNARAGALAGVLAIASLGGAIWWGARENRSSADPSGLGAGADSVSRAMFARADERMYQGSAEGIEEAIVLLEQVRARVPRDPVVHARLATALVRSVIDGGAREREPRWLDTAEAHARHAIALDPASADAHVALGASLHALDRPAEAVAQHQRALDLDPEHASAMMGLGRSLMVLDRQDEAFVWIERALDRVPSLPGARTMLVTRYRVHGMPVHARHHIDEGLALSPTDGELQWQRVMVDLAGGDTTAARRSFQERLQLLGSAEQARLQGWFSFLSGDLPAARRWVDRVVATGSASYDRRMYGEVYRATGDRARGDSMLQAELVHLEQEERRTGGAVRGNVFALAYMLASLDQRDEAIAALARWDSLGGAYDWSRMEREHGWAAWRGDARFERIVSRSTARLDSIRARVIARLDAERLPAHLPRPTPTSDAPRPQPLPLRAPASAAPAPAPPARTRSPGTP